MQAKIDNKEKILDRLRMVKLRKGWTDKEFGAAIGYTNMGRFLSGERPIEKLLPSMTTIGVSLDWLLTGQGKMFLHEIRYDDTEPDRMAEETQRQEIERIQYYFDRGMLHCGCRREDGGIGKLMRDSEQPKAGPSPWTDETYDDYVAERGGVSRRDQLDLDE